LPAARGKSRSLDLVAGELQVSPNVGITGCDFLGLMVGRNRAAYLAGFEKCVAQVEIERGRRGRGVGQLLVGCGCVSEFAFFVKFVGGVEGDGRALGAARKRAEEQEG